MLGIGLSRYTVEVFPMSTKLSVQYFNCRNALLVAHYRRLASAINFADSVSKHTRIPALLYANDRVIYDAADPKPVTLHHVAR